MKYKFLSLLTGIVSLGALTTINTGCSSQQKEGKEITFKVYGNCEMCEKTIEGSLAKDQGIFSADWNKDTKMMIVRYDTSKIEEKAIHHSIASTGYDTELEKGNDEAYKNLHQCCQYDRKK